MNLRREMIEIVLTFLTAGTLMTNVDGNAYQKVYTEHDQQETKIQQALASEFISDAQQQLEQNLESIAQAEKTETRSSLRSRLTKEKQLVTKIQKSLRLKEARVAKIELAAVKEDFAQLETLQDEPFVLATDSQKITALGTELAELAATKQVAPIREVAKKVVKLTSETTDNQTEMIRLVTNLKAANKTATELSKKKYLLAEDKRELEKNQKENAQFFADADVYPMVKSRNEDSTNLIQRLTAKQKESEQDFSKYEKSANELLKITADLLASSDLTPDEKEKLTAASRSVTNALQLKEYRPGDLGVHFQTLQTSQQEITQNRQKRLMDAQKKAEAEKAAQAAEAKKAAEKSPTGSCQPRTKPDQLFGQQQ